MKYVVGDTVRVVTKDKEFEGMLLPEKEDTVILKLSNGYNIGIDKKTIQKISLVKKHKKNVKTKTAPRHNKKLPTISILHTGGTIASKVDYETGGVKASYTVEDFLEMFPEITKIANITSNLVSNMMSEDMRFSHYKKMSDAIVKEIKTGVDGIIIGHGTDTLALTAAALSFVFENLPVPVILVGSQRSSDRGSTDAAMNLICAAEFIVKTDFKGVGVCMHENTDDDTCVILPPTKTRKIHTSRRDAFKAVNDAPIARIDYGTKKIEFIKKEQKKAEGKFVVKNKLEDKVAVIKTYPNMLPDLIETLTKKKYKGLILEATGIGQAPTNIEENLPNYEALKAFIAHGGIVVLTSQCIFGRVHQDIYSNSRRLANIGVIFGGDMLTETAFVKLAWLLGNFKKDEVTELVTQNLRGEINTRILEDQFLDEHGN